jgi:hypothetical protein
VDLARTGSVRDIHDVLAPIATPDHERALAFAQCGIEVTERLEQEAKAIRPAVTRRQDHIVEDKEGDTPLVCARSRERRVVPEPEVARKNDEGGRHRVAGYGTS